MPPKTFKRPAAAAAPVSRKKRAVRDETQKQCALVVEALGDSTLEKSLKTMLAKCVASSLRVPADVRHPYQVQLVDMIGEALVGCKEQHEAKKKAACSKLDSMATEKAKREAAVPETEAIVTEKHTAAEASKDAAAVTANSLATAKKLQREAQISLKVSETDHAGHLDKKKDVDAAIPKLAQMKEAAGAAADVREVLANAKKAGCEETLVASLPESLKKEPTDRGTFDGVAISQLAEFLDKASGDLVQKVHDAEATKVSQGLALEAATEALNAASKKSNDAAAAYMHAVTAEKEAEKAAKTAKASVKSFVTELANATEELKEATEALTSFAEGALGAFKELKERKTPAPVAEGAEDVEADAPSADVAE